MKKFLIWLVIIACVAGVAYLIFGCNRKANAKSLVAYYSKTGNTEIVAQKIAERTGATLFKIETADPNHYPDDYETLTNMAQQEINNNATVEINASPDLSKYDTIYVGTPVWWGTMATPVKVFLGQNDMSGKTIVPFTTSGGSGLGNVPADVAALTPNSEHANGFTVLGTDAATADAEIDAWLESIK